MVVASCGGELALRGGNRMTTIPLTYLIILSYAIDTAPFQLRIYSGCLIILSFRSKPHCFRLFVCGYLVSNVKYVSTSISV